MTSISQIDVLFSGISNTSSYPPHNGLAVGPNNIVMAEGSRIEWTNLAGGAPTIQSVYSFFSSLGATATNSLFDPRCIYDSASGRFIIIMENIGSNGAVSNIDIAVSKDSNPNDGWYFASLNTSLTINGQLTSSDRPSISVDASNVYITAPQYNVNVSGYAGTETWVIGKTAGAGGGLYNGGTMTVLANQITPSSQGIFSVAAGNNGKTYYACDYSTGSQIVVVVQAYDVATSTFGPATTISLGNIDQGGSYTAQQQGTTLLLDAGDKRVQNLVYSNGYLYGIAEEKPIGSSVPLVHWFKIDVSNPNSPTLVQQGDISGASLGTNVATFNGSIAVDGAGDVIINFTASGPNMYPSDYYVYRAASDPSGTFSAPVLYQASTGFFNSGNGSSVQRWGTYSTAIPDPANPNAFWISNEFVANNWWQTSVAKVEIINSNIPIISSVVTSATGIINGNGILNAGKAVTLTVNFSAAVTVNMTNGSPTLALNDGGSAGYVGGSGSSALVFSYTVQAGQNTSDLIISSLGLNGATIRDGTGNNADLSGATNYNPAGTLQIDTAAPAAPTGLSLDTTTDSATKGDGITNFVQVKINGTAEAGSTVTLYDSNGTTVLDSGVANAVTGAFSITTSSLSSGAHAITAKATDTAGNTGAASTVYAVSIDTVAPAAPTGLSLDASTDSGTLGDGITNFTQVKIDGTAEPGSTVTLRDTNGTTIIGSGIADISTGAFSINTSTLSAGTHNITATATDSAGNIGPSSSAYEVTVNGVPPAAPTGLTLDASTDSGTLGDGVTNLTQVKIDGTAGPGNAVILYDTNGTTVLGSGIADASTGAFSITTSTLSGGTHAITAKAADSIGNISAASAVYPVIIDTTAPPAPSGLLLDTTTDSATKGDGITNFTQVKIDGTAEAGSTVTLYDSNGTTVLGSGTANATTGAFSITTSSLSSGAHAITAKATDAAGNIGAASSAYSVTIDTSAPAAPTGLSLDASTDSGTLGDGITNFTQVKIDGTAEAGSAVTLYDSNGTTVLGAGIASATNGAFSITTAALASGGHNIIARATDAAGNVGTASAPYSVTISSVSYDHIVVVIDENKDYGDVIGSPDAPFINSLLAAGTLFTSYSAVAHPSQPNYLALFSGSTQGVTDDAIHFFSDAPTLAGELAQAGYSFIGYAESSSTRSHDPWESFGESQSLGQNFNQFPTDFSQLPTVSFVIPNLANDMHDGTVAQGDQWLATNLGAYATWAQTHNSLLIVTFDENDGSAGNRIPTVIVGAGIPTGESGQAVDHYSLLHTIESMYGLPGITANDINAPILDFSAVAPPSSTSEIDTQFSGISDTSSYPPHNALAVGPNYIVMLEGSRIEWTNLAGGSANLQSVYQFFKPLGTTATNSLFDPRAVYDSVNGRYIVTMDNIGSNGAISSIDVAVSKDSNPNDGWYFASLNTALTINGHATSSDTPVVSVDGSNIYITAPQYNISGGGWQGTGLWIIGDTAGTGGGIYNGGTMTVTASETTSSSQGIYRVVAGDNGKVYYASSYSTGSQIVVTLQVYDVATNTFGPISTVGLGNIDQGGSYTAQQQGTSLLLDATDKRVQNLAYSNGFLYGITEEKPIGSSVPQVHWFKIDVSNPNSPTLVAQGDISGASIGTNVATFNGSIAADAAGDIIINFTASGPNMYPSDYYVYKAASDPSSAFSAPVLYQASSSFFNSGNGSNVQRWGINSTSIADPSDPHSFWISNEYVANGWWQTVVAQVQIESAPEAPSLTLGSTALTVSAGGSVALPISVVPFDTDDTVSITISGLTNYETVTDNLDQTTFSGSSITLSAAEVNSGLVLHSSYGGSDQPVNALTVTASNLTAGEVATSAPQTIAVTDPPAVPQMAASTPPSALDSNPGFGPASMDRLASLMNQYMATGFHGSAGHDIGQGYLALSTLAHASGPLSLLSTALHAYSTTLSEWRSSGRIG